MSTYCQCIFQSYWKFHHELQEKLLFQFTALFNITLTNGPSKYFSFCIQQKYSQEGLLQPAHFSCCTIHLMAVRFTSLPLYLPVLSESSLCGRLFRCARLGQGKFFLPLLDINLSSLSFPAFTLVTILTELSRLPLTQRTQLI